MNGGVRGIDVRGYTTTLLTHNMHAHMGSYSGIRFVCCFCGIFMITTIVTDYGLPPFPSCPPVPPRPLLLRTI